MGRKPIVETRDNQEELDIRREVERLFGYDFAWHGCRSWWRWCGNKPAEKRCLACRVVAAVEAARASQREENRREGMQVLESLRDRLTEAQFIELIGSMAPGQPLESEA